MTDPLTRLKEATAPSRELDLELHMELCPELYADRWSWDDETRPPKLTSSIDASLALVERKLPGKPVLFGTGQTELTKPWARIGSWPGCDAVAETLPLAILIALFTALQETDQ